MVIITFKSGSGKSKKKKYLTDSISVACRRFYAERKSTDDTIVGFEVNR